MTKIFSLTSNRSTSFHSVLLNFIYVTILIICHFLIPYIHELVYSFFSGLFLIFSTILFFYLNAVLRTSSISHFSYFSLFFRIISSTILLLLSMVFIAFISNTTEIIKRSELLTLFIYLSFFSVLAMVLFKYLYSILKIKEQSHIILFTDHLDEIEFETSHFGLNSNAIVKQFHINDIKPMLDFAVNKGVNRVYISINSQNLNTLETLVKDLSIYAFDLYWILPESIFAKNLSLPSIKPILLNGSPISLDTNQYLLKRSLDVVGSLSILVFISPMFILVASLIKITDRGPIFYSQLRHGQYGKEFNMLKFRSMDVASDYSDQQVTHDDPRVTLIGRVIRKTSFDEIPQLFNILRGEMSLVGPRPHILAETNRYSKEIISFLVRHQVKPGLTGLAQIRTRGKTSTVELMQEKFESDLEYINQWTLYLDLKILINTPLSLWKNRNTNL
ncbi:exopolysaccharide biosynthesis polyprenyl glycosylphosphotransferase [Gammaproteobacteria bacterium]|nr:exopolysaccharide biosynthesis polyprenyl glycosylphosphotransferase [Gammaproteobacteria bacterium]